MKSERVPPKSEEGGISMTQSHVVVQTEESNDENMLESAVYTREYDDEDISGTGEFKIHTSSNHWTAGHKSERN